MIARISGQLLSKSPSHLVVEVHGVGYRVFVPLTTFYELPEAGQTVVLYIHTHVKQDSINLFGFLSPEERDIFQLMLAVNGIGPKLAVSILSGIAAGELLRALSQGDVKRLLTVPGVGKKMAERIVLELKDRAAKITAQGQGADIGVGVTAVHEDLQDDALSALMNLGYKNQAAKDALSKVCKDAPAGLTLDLLLKNALKVLAG